MAAPPRAASPPRQCRPLAGDVSDKLEGSLPCQQGQGGLSQLPPARRPAPARRLPLPAWRWVQRGETPRGCPGSGALASVGLYRPPSSSRLCSGAPTSPAPPSQAPCRCQSLVAAATPAARAGPGAGAPHGHLAGAPRLSSTHSHPMGAPQPPHSSPHGYPWSSAHPTGTHSSPHRYPRGWLTPRVPTAHPTSAPGLGSPPSPPGSWTLPRTVAPLLAVRPV